MPTLPRPSPEALLLSQQLLSQIIIEIKTTGPIPFSRYMQLALYAPGLGYYQNAYQKFGEQGDFVTAPEISPLFSYCLANRCAETLADLQDGDILEFGAGSGVMAADILCHLKKLNQLPAHYYILELSANLKAQQYETIKNKIPEYLDRVIWLSQLPEKSIQGVVLANEVLDAMPVDLYVVENSEAALDLSRSIREREWRDVSRSRSEPERSEGQSCLHVDITKEMQLTFQACSEDNYLAEINLFLPAWIKSLSDILSHGAAIIIDYGFLEHEYYHPDRKMGTLMCHYRHHTHLDPFLYPGLQDITTHVNFTAVGEAAEVNGFEVAFSNQAQFLFENGLLSLVDNQADDKNRLMQNQQIQKLTSPNEMGELFKVMVLKR